MTTTFLYSWVEDAPSAAVARKLIEFVNGEDSGKFEFREGFPSVERGFGNIKKKTPSLVEMARRGISSFVITDLDSGECAPALIQRWAGLPADEPLRLPSALLLRVAVREVESWIIADQAVLGVFLKISPANFSVDPDSLKDPKEHLLQVVRKKATKKWCRKMLPQYPTSSIGPEYNNRLCQFVADHWDPGRAMANSQSLARTVRALREF